MWSPSRQALSTRSARGRRLSPGRGRPPWQVILRGGSNYRPSGSKWYLPQSLRGEQQEPLKGLATALNEHQKYFLMARPPPSALRPEPARRSTSAHCCRGVCRAPRAPLAHAPQA